MLPLVLTSVTSSSVNECYEKSQMLPLVLTSVTRPLVLTSVTRNLKCYL
ncbi:hypothetical protein [Magpiepox virus]|nr:hypothetical protein [Magpiepox virus]QGM48976.1 hypothetical protein [Magpiepox virus]